MTKYFIPFPTSITCTQLVLIKDVKSLNPKVFVVTFLLKLLCIILLVMPLTALFFSTNSCKLFENISSMILTMVNSKQPANYPITQINRITSTVTFGGMDSNSYINNQVSDISFIKNIWQQLDKSIFVEGIVIAIYTLIIAYIFDCEWLLFVMLVQFVLYVFIRHHIKNNNPHHLKLIIIYILVISLLVIMAWLMRIILLLTIAIVILLYIISFIKPEWINKINNQPKLKQAYEYLVKLVSSQAQQAQLLLNASSQ